MSFPEIKRAKAGLPTYGPDYQPIGQRPGKRMPHKSELHSARQISKAPHAHLFIDQPQQESEAKHRQYDKGPTLSSKKGSPSDEELATQKGDEKRKVENKEIKPKSLIPPPKPPTAWETFWEWNFPEEGGVMSWVMTALHIATLGVVLLLGWMICSIIDYSSSEPSRAIDAAPIRAGEHLIDLEGDDEELSHPPLIRDNKAKTEKQIDFN